MTWTVFLGEKGDKEDSVEIGKGAVVLVAKTDGSCERVMIDSFSPNGKAFCQMSSREKDIWFQMAWIVDVLEA